jgi:hypothetical protein
MKVRRQISSHVTFGITKPQKMPSQCQIKWKQGTAYAGKETQRVANQTPTKTLEEIRQADGVFCGCSCDTSCDSFGFTYRLLL